MARDADLIEIRFMYQAPPDADERRHVFYVRVVPGQILIDLYGAQGPALEGLDVSFLEVIRSAVERVERLKLPAVVEQQG